MSYAPYKTLRQEASDEVIINKSRRIAELIGIVFKISYKACACLSCTDNKYLLHFCKVHFPVALMLKHKI